nr:hypothetical protein KitaXyl93_13170 [Kitasatospora sp. Xyl93]
MSVAEPVAGVRARIASYGPRLSVAAVNGPSATVVSGDADALRELADSCGDSPRARMIPVDYASHSAHVDELREEILSVLQGIAPSEARIPMVSALTGAWLSGPELDPAYWYASLRETVEFDRAVRILADAGHGVFLEVSPHPVLTPAIADSLEERSPVVVGTLRRDEGGAQRLLTSFAEAYVRGLPVDWAGLVGGGSTVDLPTYAFEHRHYWPEAVAEVAEGSVVDAEFWAAVEGGDADGLAAVLNIDGDRLGEVLPALADWRRRERAGSAVAGWRYRVSWVPVSESGGVLAGTWLLVGESPDAAAVAEALESHGATVVRSAPDGVADAVAACSDLRGVVSLLALDESPVGAFPLVPGGLAATVALVRELGRLGVSAPLWVVTRGAVGAVAGDVVRPVQAQVWGLGAVAALELAGRWGGLVDLPAVVDARVGARLVSVLVGDEDQVAVRAGGVVARRLVRAGRPVVGEVWSPRGSVLVTGGTSGVGAITAQWVADRGASRVVLTSRSGPGAAGVAELAASIAARGSAVQVVACDVADRASVAGLLDSIDATGPALSSVVHSAGVGDRRPVEEIEPSDLYGLLSAKVGGAMVLDELTVGRDLDAFVLFSSGAGVWGSGGLGGYAAANAHLDALVEDRRSRGLVASSVAWGLWSGVGMAASSGGERLREFGMEGIDGRRGMLALGQVLDAGEGAMVVAGFDWSQFVPTYTLHRASRLLADLPEVRAVLAAEAAVESATEEVGEWAGRLAGMPVAEQRQVLTDLVRGHAAAVLGHESADDVLPQRAFKELGFDSVGAVELRNRLSKVLGVKLASTMVFDHPNATALADYLRGELVGTAGQTAQADGAVQVVAAAIGEPIAIVGMGCRYPGGAVGPEQFWSMVASGTDTIGGFPTDRGWDAYEEEFGKGQEYRRQGGFVHDAAEFDAGFFGISPREALSMDPQQRLLLETSWEAIEHGGIDPKSLHGSATGVFVGANFSGYSSVLPVEDTSLDGYRLIGNVTAVHSGRISYCLGLTGPALTVDTACSSSLVAMHQAVQALRAGECSMALAGGVAVMVSPAAFMEFAQQGGMASSGRSKAFSDEADGIGWGEGAGMVLLERLSDARRNGHQVLAVIRGSAANQDGASNGLAAPNGPSQRRVIRAALANAQLSAADVDVVEAHGTGTTLGDPIEAQALLATYGQAEDRAADRPLWLGSVKSNIGHSQCAAGVAGVIKMVMALRHEVLPKTLFADEPSSHVDWEAGNVRLLQEAVQWPSGGRPRRAGVSAFGVSGTNVHLIVEEAPAAAVEAVRPAEQPAPEVLGTAPSVWTVSGRSAAALAGQAGRLREHVVARPELPVGDVAWSLATTRAALEHRAVVLGGERGELAAGLAAVATGQPAAGVVTGSVAAAGVGRTVFVFPGQGSQWVGMGRELAESSPVFAARLAECAEALAPHVDWQLDDVLAGRHGFEAADVVQPALWAVMVSLAAVWEAAGVAPDAVLGHSQGEIAAAAVAGILSLDDAAKVVALRSKTLKALAGRGGMLSVAEPVDGVRARIAPYGSRLSIAAVNGPSATVVSGDADALRELAESCGDSPRARMIPVDYASHSAHVDELREEILSVLQGIAPTEARIPMVSALTGAWLSGPEMGADYWFASLRETVEFERAVRILGASGHGVFVEVSPHAVLTGAVGDVVEDVEGSVVVGTLRREEGGAERLLTSLAEAYVQGAPVDWATVLGGGERVGLPTYAFQRQRFWPEPRTPQRARALVDDWRYRITWQPATGSGPAVLSGPWLLVGDAPDAGVIAEALASCGAEAVRTTLAGLDAAIAGAGADVQGVVSLLALDESPDAEFGWVPRGSADTLDLVQALGRAGVTAPLWVLTRGAVQVTDGEVTTSPIQTQVWGLGRTVGLEHADRWGGLVDLPPVVDADAAARLVGVFADGGEDQVAVRPSGVFLRRLVRAEARRVEPEGWSPRGTVLLTGGTGSIGVCIGPWLAEHGAPRVVLTSRSGPSAHGVAALAAAVANGGSAVEVVSCDLTERAQVTAMVSWIENTGPGLSTVLHSANTPYLSRVEHTGHEGLAAALGAKAAGAVHLDEATADLGIDEFVMFSSISATWGSNDHAAYAAGNSFLDGLAEDRRARGLPGTSIAWGVWNTRDWDAVDAVMDQAPGRVTPHRLLRQGMNFLDTERALTALGEVLADDETFIAVADVEWEKFAPVFTAARPRPLLDTIPEAQEDTAPRTVDEQRSEFAARLAGLPVAERRRSVVELVRTQAAAVLGHDSADEIVATRAFRELGFDSLTAVDLRNRLNAAVGVRLPSTVIFDHPSASALADEILAALFGSDSDEDQTVTAAAVSTDPIAIVGMACRYPGGVRSPEELWDLIAAGGDAISGFPADRGWDVDALFDPDPDAEGSTYVVEGGFLSGAGEFDAGFFGISPREAMAMDPQQRLLLETSWEAVERAGIDPKSLHGSATGVFIGAAASGYIGVLGDEAEAQAHLITGNALSVLSGRVSYTLGLNGPAVTVDTACSSSLVAMHQAVQALRSGECTVALAGGVTVMADPGEFVSFSRLRALSADGRCKAFGEGADGMGMGEGVGMLVLERLSDARRNGHQVLGVVRGSAINQDGASNGLTAPNGPAQRRVIRAALASAQLSAADVDVVEAHGTGTELGDPIEAQALLATYGQAEDRAADRPLWLGSVKSNIGHAQQAAGVAGVIKMVMALRAGVLPKTLHADEPSSHVDWETGNVRLLQDAVQWPAGERPRRAGVSAFGISGTNAHVIIEEAPVEAEAPVDSDSGSVVPVLSGDVPAWVLSGRDTEALAGQAGRLREHVLARPELPVGDVAWSLATTRAALEHRAVVLGGERGEFAERLAAVATGQPAAGVVTGSVAAAGVGRTVFVFPGQGSQWVGMGRELAESSPVFAARLAECAEALAPYVDWQLDDVLAGRHGFEAADVVQPALWAVMVSLAAVWEAAGVAPDAVVGHSQGEIAAAAVAGILSLDDAAKVVALRSRTLKVLAGRGGMLSIAEPVDGVRARIASYGSRLSVAAVNGPSATVVSGDADALRELAESCGDSPRARMIPVDYASHSAHVDELREEILAVLQGITPTEAQIPMVSALTGAWLSGPELDPAYWYASLRETVEFERAVRLLGESGHGVFLEVSPHPVLTPAIADSLEERSPVVVGTLRRDEGGAQRLLTSLAEVYAQGLPVDWAAVLGRGSTVDLPTYAFRHRHYWPEADRKRADVTVATGAEAGFWTAVESGDVTALADLLGVDPADAALGALTDWRRRERAGSAVAGWRYRVSWVPVSESGGVLAGTWLLVGESPDVAAVAEALESHGATVVRSAPDGVADVVAACSDLRGVVSLLALEESPVGAFPLVPGGLAATVALVRELGRLGVSAPLWVVTRGAVGAVAGDAVRPVQAQVWGLGAVAALELAGRWGGLIDLPAAVDARTGARLASVLVGDEDQVAVRAGGVVARRLVRAGRPVVREVWSPRGSVLVTGGTSGVGAITAQWVADRGASRVVLTSRSGPGAAGVAELAASIAARGSAVQVVACDVADRASVAGLLDSIDATGPVLSSVVHSAGVGDRRPVEEIEPSDLYGLLSAKVGGAMVLDELTAGRDLDAFVLFSSGAGVWGSGGLGGYAAANAHLDALVEDRRSRGLVASSVAWGLWSGVGMAASSGGERLREFGMEGIDGRRGMLALGQVLDAGEGAMVVAGFDWSQFVPTYTLHRASRLLADLPEVRAVLAAEAAVESATEEVGEWAGRLAGMPVAEQRQVLTDLVRGHAAAVLGHESADDVLPQRAFKELGFDSVGAVELRNRLSKVLGVKLASTMVFDHPNATALAEQILREFIPEQAAPEGDSDELALREAISAIPLARIRQAGLLDLLLQLADPAQDNGAGSRTDAESIDGMDAEDLIRIALDGKDS